MSNQPEDLSGDRYISARPDDAESVNLRVVAAVVLSVVVVPVVAGCSGAAVGDEPRPAPTTTTSTAPALDTETQVECSNVERAYNAWHWEPMSSADWAQFQVKMRMDDGDAFHDAVEGYTDKPVLDLVVAVANYNYELSLLNANYVAQGSADPAAAEEARVAVVDAYETFQTETCGS